MALMLTRSLDDERNKRYLTETEFAHTLGISPQTYRRVKNRDPKVEHPTRRQIAARLGLPPHIIAELQVPASSDYLAALDAAIDRANRTGWIVGDPISGMPTGTVVVEQYTPAMQPNAEDAGGA